MESLVSNITPAFVEVTASESRLFQKEHQYPFAEFEALALSVALTNPVGGYDKTYVRVHFSNQDVYECRLDLGCGGNDLGFAEHCLSIVEYDERQQYKAHLEKRPPANHYQKIVEQLKQYHLDEQQILIARHKAKEATANAKAEEQKQEELKRIEQQKAFELHRQKEQEFQDNLVVPDWAKAVIVATLTEYDSDNSDPFSGYHQTKTVRTVILAWSKHTRNLFPELRKACLNHSDIQFLHDKSQGLEHRQTHWSGDGYFLSDKDFIRHGWQVRKVILRSKRKAYDVPFGEWAITE
ncbi:LPD25 domain-containing protein [Vibrio gigantis]|uniref:LPD25 domain-containing protein n=1 Tax=Vibrio gigantis TaxID=296199 RepID=UPI001BFCF089|nr:LPD25 domain-containing protein [Vibrio gigantis]